MGRRAIEWKMALVIGVPIRRCRLKILNFIQLTRNFNSSTPIKRTIGRNDKFWYLIGGSLVAFTYAKWHRTGNVQAFNPKKLKVSSQWKIKLKQKKKNERQQQRQCTNKMSEYFEHKLYWLADSVRLQWMFRVAIRYGIFGLERKYV